MRTVAVILAFLVIASSCSDDRVKLARGPLGPARYEVEVRAAGNAPSVHEFRRASLRVTERTAGAHFTLQAGGGDVISADLYVLPDGSVLLSRVRGAPGVGNGQTDLASLAGQLTPPLPRHRVRLGDRWSSTQHISTATLTTRLHTVLRMVRFRRIASTDAVEFAGDISGRLRTTDPRGVFSGNLVGQTEIVWAVQAGRVVAAQTRLVWTLEGFQRVTLETRVRPT